MELPKIPRELEEAVRKNELLVFVGAGLSYNLFNIKKQPLKGWSNLVHQILLHLKEEGHDVEALIQLIDRYEPIDILRLIEKDKHIPRKKISEFIKDFLDLDDENNFDLHRKLYRLSNKIITTNYDCAFEKAVRELEKNTAYKGKNYELTKHKQPGASLLFKLHGCFKDVDSMVLYPSGYDALYQNKERDAEHSILVLRNIIFNKSILFIGAGMGDFQINNLFSEIKNLQGDYNQKHFIITKNPLDSSLDFLTPLLVSDFAQIKGIVDRLIEIKEHSSNNDTEQIKTLKAQYAASEERIKELETMINPDRDKLLEREAWKYFSRGVTFSLEGDSENAIKEYEQAVELKPDMHEAWNNWGTDLGKLAIVEDGDASDILFQKAFSNFERAININPKMDIAYNNWGNFLGNWALKKTGEDIQILFFKAIDKFKESILVNSNMYDAYYNWGTCLSKLANEKKTDTEAFESFSIEAFEKFKKATEIKPEMYDTYTNWGNALMRLAKIKGISNAEECYNKAHEVLTKGVEYGGNPYNLACLYALRNQKQPALETLKTCLENKHIQPDFVLQDEDWQGYLHDPDFLDLVKHYQS